MFVGERMSRPVICVSPDQPINEVLAMFKEEHIRRAPVMKDGKLVGIVSDSDLLNASPSPVTTLSVWEMNYLISKVMVKDVMTKKVITVEKEIPIEERAQSEITEIGGRCMAPAGMRAANPAFDVTPASYVDGIITERGVARAPYEESLPRLAGEA